MTPNVRTTAFVTAFAVTYPVLYVACTYWNWALFTYHPALGVFGIGPDALRAGPAMYWYGWVTTSAIGAGLMSAGWTVFAGRGSPRIPSLLASIVPVLAMIVAAALMSHFFLH